MLPKYIWRICCFVIFYAISASPSYAAFGGSSITFQDYHSTALGSPTITVQLDNAAPRVMGPAVLVLTNVYGDFDHPNAYFEVFVNGTKVGGQYSTGTACTSLETFQIEIPEIDFKNMLTPTLDAITGLASVTIELRANSDVDTACRGSTTFGLGALDDGFGATFEYPVPLTLDVDTVGNGNGTVTSTVSGISCVVNNGAVTSGCSGRFLRGSEVTLTATPDPGSIVVWNICDSTSDNVCKQQLGEYDAVQNLLIFEDETVEVSFMKASAGTFILQVNVDGTDVTLNTTSPSNFYNMTLVTNSGTVTLSNTDAPTGQHDLTFPDLSGAGYTLTSISCDDDNSTNDLSNFLLSIEFEPAEVLTCIVVYETLEEKTNVLISDYLSARNIFLLAHQPERERRLNKLRAGNIKKRTSKISNLGSNPTGLNSPFKFSVTPDELYFLANTGPIDAFSNQTYPNVGGLVGNKSPEIKNSLDFWVEGHAAKNLNENQPGGKMAVLYSGVDFALNDKVLIGLMGQFDWMKRSFHESNLGLQNAAEIAGSGWMVGPYTTINMGNLYFDGRFAWGKSSNELKVENLASSKFNTNRYLLMASLIGDFNHESWTISPASSFQFISEKQLAFTDAEGIVNKEQQISHGDFRFGPKIGYAFKTLYGEVYNPWIEANGVYTFTNKTDNLHEEAAKFSEGLTAQIKAGLTYTYLDVVSVLLSAQYDGLGSDEQSYGGMVKLAFSF